MTISKVLRRNQSAIALAAMVLVVGFLVLSPIGIILVKAFRGTDGGFSLEAWLRAFSEPGLTRSIVNTIGVVIATQLISTPIAIFIAWLLARTDLPGRRWFEFGFWMAFLIPILGTTTGWILLLDPMFGLINQALRLFGMGGVDGPFNIYSYWGIVFAHLVTLSISVKVILLTPGFRNLDASFEEASLVSGAGMFKTMTRIILPVMTPVLMVVFLMALIRALEAFEIELILGRPIDFSVYSTKMYQLLRGSPPDMPSATVLAKKASRGLYRRCDRRRRDGGLSGRLRHLPHVHAPDHDTHLQEGRSVVGHGEGAGPRYCGDYPGIRRGDLQARGPVGGEGAPHRGPDAVVGAAR